MSELEESASLKKIDSIMPIVGMPMLPLPKLQLTLPTLPASNQPDVVVAKESELERPFVEKSESKSWWQKCRALWARRKALIIIVLCLVIILIVGLAIGIKVLLNKQQVSSKTEKKIRGTPLSVVESAVKDVFANSVETVKSQIIKATKL